MVFSSLQFVLIFIPIFFGIYYLVPNHLKNAILLTGSLVFYFVGTVHSPEHMIVFLVCILMDYYIGLAMARFKHGRKFFLVLGILVHLAFLCVFKYLNFITAEISKFSDSFNTVANIALPIGISFYTFQGISYLVDVYKGRVKAEPSLLRFACYISMFEQLIAGPIVTFDLVQKDLVSRKITTRQAVDGVRVFVFGLGLKVLLANPIGKMWGALGNIGYESISTPLAWMGIIAFSLQLYFDFFGYSLMAIGLGKMLGFNLPQNFNHPYISRSMTEFWRRWHMTLGSWFREYVYIPLGGNRRGIVVTILNLLVVWVLTGIWHGAGYNFALWGLLLFVVLVLEKFVYGGFLKEHRVFSRIYMLLLIPLSWAIFAVTDFHELGVLFSRLFPFFGGGFWSVFRHDWLKYLKMYYPFFIIGFIFSTKLPYNIIGKIKSNLIKDVFLLAIFIGSIYCMYRGYDDPFLYFRF